MKILMLSLERLLFAPESETNFSIKRMKAYAEKTDQITVIVHSLKKHQVQEMNLNSKIKIIPTQGFTPVDSFLRMYQIARKLIKTQKYDLITTQDPFLTGLVGVLLNKRERLPVSMSIFSSFFDDVLWLKERPLNRILHPLGKKLIHHADSIRVECETEKNKLVALGIHAHKVFIVPVLVFLDEIKNTKDTFVRKKYAAENQKLILSVGRLEAQKDFGTLLKAVREVNQKPNNYQFLIVGSGSQEKKLKTMAQKFNLKNVIFAGKIGFKELPQYYQACDLFILPSIYEGIPLVLIEAQAAAKPVICTRLRDVQDVVKDNLTGLIVNPQDPKEMAQKIEKLFQNPEHLKQMGQAAQKFILETYDYQKCLDQLIHLWKNTIKP